MKIISIVGARPQFIKAAAVSRAINRHNLNSPEHTIDEVLVHTGQHYDPNMSEIFFRELEIPGPRYHLEVGSGSHGRQTGEMLERIETVLLKEKADAVVVYGDTNSTLAGALAAAKIHHPVAHVEAGLRSWNRRMPEEVNRVVADHLSSLLLCPTETAVKNLTQEGIVKGVHLVGDVMQDVLFWNLAISEKSSSILETLDLHAGRYLLATVHRADNTDDKAKLESIIGALAKMAAAGEIVVFPAHPRTRKALKDIAPSLLGNLTFIDPVGYRDMVWLERNAKMILTDSGGVQKEAYWLNVPCAVLREETEWVETSAGEGNRLVGTDPKRIWAAFESASAHPRSGLPDMRLPARNASDLHVERLLAMGERA